MPAPPKEIHDEGGEELRPYTTVHAFDVNAFVENLAVRRSGQVLVTVHNTNELIEIDATSKAFAKVVHRFASNLFGIVEVEEDIFYVSAGTIGEAGSFAIHKVDMSSGKVNKLADVPDALFLNGSALLSSAKGIILVADSILGVIFAIDIGSAKVTKWLQHESLKKTTSNPNYPGVNGIKMHNGSLYLSNTEAKTFLRAGLTENGDATGSVELVYDRCNIDDFVFDAEGAVYLTSHVFNSVYKIHRNGARSTVAGGPDDTVVAGTTAAAFGRTNDDGKTLYVTTNGGMSNPVDGKIGPGRLLSIPVDSP